MARRIGRLLAVAALLLAGVLIASMWIRVVPTKAFGWCVVTDGLSQDDVHARCGQPCGHGDIPKTTNCGPNWDLFLCSSSCDVYSHTGVCYAQGQVADLVSLPGRGRSLIPSCSW